MVEWSITAVLKTAVPRGTGGSNPSLSAQNLKKKPVEKSTGFVVFIGIQTTAMIDGIFKPTLQIVPFIFIFRPVD